MIDLKAVTRVLLAGLLLFSFGSVTALAQFSSGVEGTAKDQSGAVVAGAKVMLTDTRLGVSKDTTTNQNGYFHFDSIAASSYSLQIQMTGFKTYEQDDLVLQVGEIRTVSPALEVGSVSADVTSSAGLTVLISPTCRTRSSCS